jgi:vitamin B12/bleomycin/antimicrobial peptide transport system ATP-binding/permease protein
MTRRGGAGAPPRAIADLPELAAVSGDDGAHASFDPTDEECSVTGLASTLATIWRLAIPYFRSEERWAGRVLLAAVIAIELSIVAINVMLNQWNARFFNAVQDRDGDAFISELLFFCALVAPFIVLRVYQIYLQQWLQIRWRTWLTRHYLARWLEASTHYRMQLLGDAADNPDQRIAEDVRLFIDRTLFVGINLLSSIVSFASFVTILWALSAQAPLHLFGTDLSIPGYLVWVAVIYAVVGTALTHLIGRRLINLNFFQQRYEADFRFNLVRTRENSEQIALLHGEPAEHERLMDRFHTVVTNFRAIMSRIKLLTFFTASYSQISIIFPYVVVSPSYFAGKITLGTLTQTVSAFGSVQDALSIFITVYQQLAEWRAVIERLAGFDAAIVNGEAVARTPPRISVDPAGREAKLDIAGLDVHLPDGTPLVSAAAATLSPGDRALVTGPSGSGKSTLFRAIGGIWPFGSGTITLPSDARLKVMPQRPYLPIGSLEAAVSYPAMPGTFAADDIREALAAVGLPGLAARLFDHEHWNRMLSLGEQQRLAVARALLHAPDYLFLDEATASLDEASEAELYHLLQRRLPNATIVSIGHRSTLRAFHERHLTLTRDGNRAHLREVVFETTG